MAVLTHIERDVFGGDPVVQVTGDWINPMGLVGVPLWERVPLPGVEPSRRQGESHVGHDRPVAPVTLDPRVGGQHARVVSFHPHLELVFSQPNVFVDQLERVHRQLDLDSRVSHADCSNHASLWLTVEVLSQGCHVVVSWCFVHFIRSIRIKVDLICTWQGF